MEELILQMWQSGLSKNKVAEIYKRRNNEMIKLIRLEMHNRHAGKFMSNYEALEVVEKVIYKYVMNRRKTYDRWSYLINRKRERM